MKKLIGITWNNTRGYVPKVATAQRFSETHPDILVEWQKRPLEEFANFPIDELARRFDFIDLDHPSIGYAAERNALLPLEDWLPADFLADQAVNTVGRSHESYRHAGRQWGLAIDAATPVSSHRPDLMAQRGLRPPQTWDELLTLARANCVLVPAVPIDCLMYLFMFCLAAGEEPFLEPDKMATLDTGRTALQWLKELVLACPARCLELNPIQTYELMATSDRYLYCPFGFGYSQFARDGFVPHPLHFGGLVTLGGNRLRSTLGGTGLAISAHCRHPAEAASYARYIASPETQRTVYFSACGQPGHRAAWTDDEVNRRSHDYFRNTLPTLDEAYLRPRYNGYIRFQELGAPLVHDHVTGHRDAATTLAQLDELYRSSRQT